MENSPWEVLVVSSSMENRQNVADMLKRLGVDPVCVASVDQCRQLPRHCDIGLVFCDREVSGGDYRDVLSAVGASPLVHSPKVVMMADLDSAEEYQVVRRHGLFDVISAQCRPTDLEWMLIQAKRYARHTGGTLEPTRKLSQLWRAAGAGK
jgi:DNA-binding NtrC family response regulator